MATVTQAQSGTRSLPISPSLASVLETAARIAGVEVRVFSGGQPSKGQGARVGSTRHDHGNAADIYLYQNGQQLQFTNQQHLPIIQTFIQTAVANGANGIGAGTDYMGPAGLHVGFGPDGKPGGPVTVWGAGGKSRNAPGWLRASVEGIASPKSIPDAVQMASAPLPRLRPDTAALPAVKRNVAAKSTGKIGGLAPSAVASLPPARNTLTAADMNATQPMTYYDGGTLGAMPAQFSRDQKIPDVPGRAPTQPAMPAAQYGQFVDSLKAGSVPYQQLPASWRSELEQKLGGPQAAQQAYAQSVGTAPPATLMSYAPPTGQTSVPFDAVVRPQASSAPPAAASVMVPARGTNAGNALPAGPFEFDSLLRQAALGDPSAIKSAGDRTSDLVKANKEGRSFFNPLGGINNGIDQINSYIAGLPTTSPEFSRLAARMATDNPGIFDAVPEQSIRATMQKALAGVTPAPSNPQVAMPLPRLRPTATAPAQTKVASAGSTFPVPTSPAKGMSDYRPMTASSPRTALTTSAAAPKATTAQPAPRTVQQIPTVIVKPAKPVQQATAPKPPEPIGISTGFVPPAAPAKAPPVAAPVTPAKFDYSSFYKSNAGGALGSPAKVDATAKKQPAAQTQLVVSKPKAVTARQPVAPAANPIRLPNLRPASSQQGALTLPGLGGVQSRVGGVLGGLSNAYTAMGGKADPIVSTYQARNLPSNVTSHTTQNTQGGSQYRTYTTSSGKTVSTFTDAQGNNYAVVGR